MTRPDRYPFHRDRDNWSRGYRPAPKPNGAQVLGTLILWGLGIATGVALGLPLLRWVLGGH